MKRYLAILLSFLLLLGMLPVAALANGESVLRLREPYYDRNPDYVPNDPNSAQYIPRTDQLGNLVYNPDAEYTGFAFDPSDPSSCGWSAELWLGDRQLRAEDASKLSLRVGDTSTALAPKDGKDYYEAVCAPMTLWYDTDGSVAFFVTQGQWLPAGTTAAIVYTDGEKTYEFPLSTAVLCFFEADWRWDDALERDVFTVRDEQPHTDPLDRYPGWECAGQFALRTGEGEDAYTVLGPDDLTMTGDFFRIEPIPDNDGIVGIRFDGFGEGRLAYGDAVMHLSSTLPEFGFYSADVSQEDDEEKWREKFLVGVDFPEGTNTQTVFFIARGDAVIEDGTVAQGHWRDDDVAVEKVRDNVYKLTLTDPTEGRLDVCFSGKDAGDEAYEDKDFGIDVYDERTSAIAFQWADWRDDTQTYHYHDTERYIGANVGDGRSIRLIHRDGTALSAAELAAVTFSDNLFYEFDESAPDVVRLWFTGVGRGAITLGDARIRTRGDIPGVAFYDQAVAADASEADYAAHLLNEWRYDGDNDTVWLVARGENAVITRAESRCDNGLTVAQIPDGGAHAVAVTLSDLRDSFVSFAVWGAWSSDENDRFGGEDGDWCEVPLRDVRPGLCFRHAWWDDSTDSMIVDENDTPETVLRDDPGGRPSVKVYLRDAEGALTPAELSKVTVSGCAEDGKRGDDFLEVHFLAAGEGSVTYNDGQSSCSFRLIGTLPEIGFYSADPGADADDAAYAEKLLAHWTHDGTSDSVWLVARNGVKIIGVRSDCGCILDETHFNDIPEGGVRALEIPVLALDGDRIAVHAYGIDSAGNPLDGGYGRYVDLEFTDTAPGLFWRYVRWNDQGPLIDPDEEPSAYMDAPPCNNRTVEVYLRDAAGKFSEPIAPEKLVVTGPARNRNTDPNEKDRIPDNEKDYLSIAFDDFGLPTLSYTEGGTTYTRTLRCDLPGDGFFNDPADPDDKDAYLTEWVYGGTKGTDTVYYVLRGGDETYLTNVENACDADLEIQALPGNDKAYEIHLKTPYTGNEIRIRISGQWNDGNTFDDEERCIPFVDRGEGLCLRWVRWNDKGPYIDENDTPERTVVGAPGDDYKLAFYLCDADGNFSEMIAPENLVVTGAARNRNTDEEERERIPDNEKPYLCLAFDDFGSGTVEYTAGGKTYSLPLRSELPEVGFYTDTTASQDTYLRAWNYTDANQTVYLVPRDENARLMLVWHDGGASAQIALIPDGNNPGALAAAVSVADPDDGYIRLGYELDCEGDCRRDFREVRINELRPGRVHTYLTVWTDGDPVRTAVNGGATLKVNADVDVPEGAEKNDLHYQWYKCFVPETDGAMPEGTQSPWELKQAIEGATADTLELTGLTAGGEYLCEVTDDFGNSDSAWFRVNTDTGLQIAIVAPEAALNMNEIHFPAGESVTLQAAASVGKGHTFRYQWYRMHRDEWPERLEGENGATLTVSIGDLYECWAIDDEKNIVMVRFYVYADNDLDVTAENPFVFLDSSNETEATLKVIASCEKGALHYQWYRDIGTADEEDKLPNGTGASCTVTNIPSGYSSYSCRVWDDYGNEELVGFYVTSNDGLQFRVHDEAELRAALSQTGEDTYVAVVDIVDSFEITQEDLMLYDPAHFSNYQYTYMIVERGVTLTVKNGGAIGRSIHGSYDRDTQHDDGEPWGDFWNLGTIIIENGGSLEDGFEQNEGKITVKAGGRCSMPAENYGSITVESGGWLGTTMGAETYSGGEITVAEGATVEARFGGTFENGGYLKLDGDMYVGCITYADEPGEAPALHVWFSNWGEVEGRGSIYLRNLGCSFGEMDTAIEWVMDALGQGSRFDDWDDISIYRYLTVGKVDGEGHDFRAQTLRDAFPGNRNVNGEDVPGDMDTVVDLDADLDFDNCEPQSFKLNDGTRIETMGRIRIPEGATLTVGAGAVLEAEIENRGTLIVEAGGKLATTQGGDIRNEGTLTVNAGGLLVSQMGGRVVNKGAMTLDGAFNCGVVRFAEQEGGTPTDHVWFETGSAVVGSGTVLLCGATGEEDLDGCVALVKTAVNNESITVKAYEFSIRAVDPTPAVNPDTDTIDLQPGETATLAAEATVSEGAPTYQWYRTHYGRHEEKLDGKTGTQLTVGESDEYVCEAKDSYGNTVRCFFDVEVRNELDAWMVPHTDIFVRPGEVTGENPLTLQAMATATDTSHLRYQWYKGGDPYGGDFSGKLDGETGPTLTVKSVDADTLYYCDVDDGYNNYATLKIRVKVTQDKIFHVTDQAGLTAALSQTEPVAAICIEGDFTVTADSLVRFDAAHYANYRSTQLIVREGVTLTLKKAFGCDAFSYNWDTMHDAYAKPTGTLTNCGKLIVDAGGEVSTEFWCNFGEIVVNDGGRCITPAYNFGAITVNGGYLGTSQGSDMVNYGTVTVGRDGRMESRFGSSIINEASVQLDGIFVVNCFRYDGAPHMWFDNNGEMTGSGQLVLCANNLSPAEADDMIERVMDLLGQEKRFGEGNWDDIGIYRSLTAGTEDELRAALPGNRTVAGEVVAGDMDTLVELVKFDDDDEPVPFDLNVTQDLDTMGDIRVSEIATLTVCSGATLTAGVGIEPGGKVVVAEGGTLGTAQGGSIENRGELAVNASGTLISQMGGRIANGGKLTLNGLALVGCIGGDLGDGAWFDPYGGEGVQLLGSGAIVLYEANSVQMPVKDMGALVAEVRRLTDGSSVKVSADRLVAYNETVDNVALCRATIYREKAGAGAVLIAARYDAQGKLLGTETAPITAGVTDVGIARDGAATVRFFALDGGPIGLAVAAPAPAQS